MYSLTTQNLPVLSTLKGWKYGFDSPFKAEVYFVSTRNITDQKWGTKNPITLNDLRFGMLEIRAFGTYVIRVKDAPVFLKEIVGTDGHFTTEEISNATPGNQTLSNHPLRSAGGPYIHEGKIKIRP